MGEIPSQGSLLFYAASEIEFLPVLCKIQLGPHLVSPLLILKVLLLYACQKLRNDNQCGFSHNADTAGPHHTGPSTDCTVCTPGLFDVEYQWHLFFGGCFDEWWHNGVPMSLCLVS